VGFFQAMLAVPAATAFEWLAPCPRSPPACGLRLNTRASSQVWGVARTLAYLLTGATRGWEARSHTLTAPTRRLLQRVLDDPCNAETLHERLIDIAGALQE